MIEVLAHKQSLSLCALRGGPPQALLIHAAFARQLEQGLLCARGTLAWLDGHMIAARQRLNQLHTEQLYRIVPRRKDRDPPDRNAHDEVRLPQSPE